VSELLLYLVAFVCMSYIERVLRDESLFQTQMDF